MNTATIRKKLYEYIRVADDKKVSAIYTIIENDVIEPFEWWNDKDLVAELDHRSEQIKSGSDPGMLWEDAKKEILSVNTEDIKIFNMNFCNYSSGQTFRKHNYRFSGV